MLDYPGGDLRAGPEAELAEDIGHVAVGGAFGNDQLGGDLLVGQPTSDPACDGEFARCQRRTLGPNARERFTSRGGSGTAIASAAASSIESDFPDRPGLLECRFVKHGASLVQSLLDVRPDTEPSPSRRAHSRHRRGVGS